MQKADYRLRENCVRTGPVMFCAAKADWNDLQLRNFSLKGIENNANASQTSRAMWVGCTLDVNHEGAGDEYDRRRDGH